MRFRSPRRVSLAKSAEREAKNSDDRAAWYSGWKCEESARNSSSDDRTRTCGPVINSHLLYQLSYVGMFNDG